MRHNYHNLEIWKLGRELANKIYTATNSFPQTEKFGIINQLRRASVSVASNIAEGCGRDTIPQLKHFLSISIGSLAELETQIWISQDQKFISEPKAKALIEEISKIRKMTISFQKSLSIQQ